MGQTHDEGDDFGALTKIRGAFDSRSPTALSIELLVLLVFWGVALRRGFFEVILAVLGDDEAAITAFLKAEVLVLDVHVGENELPDFVYVVVDDARALDFGVARGFGHLRKDVKDRVVKLKHYGFLVLFSELARIDEVAD